MVLEAVLSTGLRKVGCGGPAPGPVIDAFPGAALAAHWKPLVNYGGYIPVEGALTVADDKAKAIGASGSDYGNTLYGGSSDCSRIIAVDVATEGAAPNQDHSVLFMAAEEHGWEGAVAYRQCWLYLRHSDGFYMFVNDSSVAGSGHVTALVGHRLEIEYQADTQWFIARIDGVQKSVFVGDFWPIYFPTSVYDGMYAHVDTATPTFANFTLDEPCYPPGRLRIVRADGTILQEACDERLAATFVYDFNQADGLLAAPWSNPDAAWSIDGNQVKWTGGDSAALLDLPWPVGTTDIAIDYTAMHGGVSGAVSGGMFWDWLDDANYHMIQFNAGSWTVYRVAGGGISAVVLNFTAGLARYRITHAIDGSIDVYRDGMLLESETSALHFGSRAGMLSNSTATRLDNFALTVTPVGHPLMIEDSENPGEWITVACMVPSGRYVEASDPRWYHYYFADVIYDERPTDLWRTTPARAARTNRTDSGGLTWLNYVLVPGKTYRVSAWVRVAPGVVTYTPEASLQVKDLDTSTQYFLDLSVPINDASWTLLSGTFTAVSINNAVIVGANPGPGPTVPDFGFYVSDWFVEELP